jgi:hypothetical protein
VRPSGATSSTIPHSFIPTARFWGLGFRRFEVYAVSPFRVLMWQYHIMQADSRNKNERQQ